MKEDIASRFRHLAWKDMEILLFAILQKPWLAGSWASCADYLHSADPSRDVSARVPAFERVSA